VVWSEPNISQIKAWSSTIYAGYQEFDFDFSLIFLNFKRKNFNKKTLKISNNFFFFKFLNYFYKLIFK
jgi:hypothetical protein